MKATTDEIKVLSQLQQIDLDLLQKKRLLEELPYRSVIAEARTKIDALQAKREKIEELKADANKRFTRIVDEESSLKKKEHGTQAALSAAGGDYRNVEARTKELAGIEKRLDVVYENKSEVEAELAKIKQLSAQIESALCAVQAQESDASTAFQSEGGALKADIATLEQEHATLSDRLSAEVLEAYNKARARSGGVVIGELAGTHCSVCRAAIESGRLIDLQASAPLGVCPNCKRLLIITNE